MTYPNWQVFLTRELAARAGNTDRDYIAAALIVRGLAARHPQAAAAVPAGETDTQAKFSGYANDTGSPLFPVMRKLWADLDVPAATGGPGVSAEQTAAALWQRAMVDFLYLPTSEYEAAQQVALQAKGLPWFGATAHKTGSGETQEQLEWGEGDGWSALTGVLGGFGAGFGSLRTELEASVNETVRVSVLADYDKLVSNSSLRRQNVRLWQEWAKGQGKYTGIVDGVWGPKSEAAWLLFAPASYAKPSTLADLKLMPYSGSAAVLFAAAISRDRWVAANPSRLPPPPETPPGPSLTDPQEPVPSAELVEEDVLITPEEDAPTTDGTVEAEEMEEARKPASEPADVVLDRELLQRVLRSPIRMGDQVRMGDRIAVVPVEEPTRRRWLPWVLGIGSVVVIGGVVWGLGRSHQKPPYEEG
jgi:hypothetical protein